ncbi:hypothetical protein FQN50_004578 [Emmonsiellopsis sp. PD_5]|nr:hypothetical protein FQN50_004578 [Emmonsiellopsis sp. PD_5]
MRPRRVKSQGHPGMSPEDSHPPYSKQAVLQRTRKDGGDTAKILGEAGRLVRHFRIYEVFPQLFLLRAAWDVVAFEIFSSEFHKEVDIMAHGLIIMITSDLKLENYPRPLKAPDFKVAQCDHWPASNLAILSACSPRFRRPGLRESCKEKCSVATGCPLHGCGIHSPWEDLKIRRSANEPLGDRDERKSCQAQFHLPRARIGTGS